MIIQEIQKGFDSSLKAVKTLVSHFSDPIHLSDAIPDSPYYDPLHGRPIGRHNITSFCIQSVKQSSFGNFDEYLEASRGLIMSYYEIVRKTCFIFEEKRNRYRDTCPYVLVEYEQMIHELMVVEGSKYSTESENDVDPYLSKSCMETVQNILSEIARDILSLTAIDKIQKYSSQNVATNEIEGNDDESRERDICNNILPTLLRISGHFVEHLNLILSTNENIYLNDEDELRKLKRTLIFILIAALSFASDIPYISEDADKNDNKTIESLLTSKSFNVYEILPSNVVKDFNLKSIMTTERCILPLGIDTHMEQILKMHGFYKKEDLLDMDFLQDPILNVHSESSYISTPWMDHTMGIGLRAGSSLLRKIASVTEILISDDGIQIDNERKASSPLSVIIRSLGSEVVAEYARANFFGRLWEQKDLEGLDVTKNATQHSVYSENKSIAFNGIIQSYKTDQSDRSFRLAAMNQKLKREPFHKIKDPLKEEPFEALPARIASSLRIISALQQPDVSPQVWSHTLPVIYSLIDSIKGYHQSLGAAVLIHLLEHSTSKSFLSAGKEKDDRNSASNIQITAQILASGRRPCQDPLSLFLLSRARLKLFELTCNEKEVPSLSRESAKESLNWIQKNSYVGPGGENIALSLLITALLGEFQPISEMLARRPYADGMEMGTLGLTVLLPLIRWDSTSLLARKVQFAALISLISHMLSSYPVMSMHGGKIMTELLSCIGRAQRDAEHDHLPSEEHDVSNALVIMAVHVASIAFTLCGRRSQDIIRKVSDGKYVSNLVQVCELIPFCSDDISKRTRDD